MANIGKYSTDSNFGAFHTLYIARASDLPEINPYLDNLLLSLNRPFDEVFTAIYFTEGTGSYSADQRSTVSGTFWEHQLSFSIPKDRVEVARELKKFEKKGIVCMIVLHNENEKKLIGNQQYPLQFVSKIETGREIADPNQRVLNLTGISISEAPRFGGYVEDVGEEVVLPQMDVSDILQRVINLEANVNSFFLSLALIENNVNTNISSINQTVNKLNTDFNNLQGLVGALRVSVNQHSTQFTQISQQLNYLQSLINQVNIGIQAIIDRRRIISVNLIAGQWTRVIHNFDLIDQDAFTHRISFENKTAFFPVKSKNNDEIEIYSSEDVTVKIILIALAAITSGKISVQSVELTANAWTQVAHNFNLTDREAFTIECKFEERVAFLPVRAVNSNVLEIFSKEAVTIKAVMIGV